MTANYSMQSTCAARPDHGKRGLTITCISLDESLRPGMPVGAPFDFTLPRETLARYDRRHRQDQERPLRPDPTRPQRP